MRVIQNCGPGAKTRHTPTCHLVTDRTPAHQHTSTPAHQHTSTLAHYHTNTPALLYIAASLPFIYTATFSLLSHSQTASQLAQIC